ncbi:MFS transporter [Sulfurimonas sp. HSL-3221]|uniref:MFS transporter n=1 Tax=Thiomicrolovo sulfuroxydans TaxID=2894755 RepID=UPI001E370723|nr:MFS transporter [Sulfurimonas sp. HSL-3221]UFS63341.1 MFS transporter [Sulfurimonas sp. HSL-3221]
MTHESKRIYGWALYDWANSAYATTVMAGFFPLFFKAFYSADTDATLSTAQLGVANAVSSIIVVLLAPLLGAIADAGGIRKRFLLLFAFLGILMSAALALVGKGQWELAAFIYVLGNIGFMGSNIFYDAFLPSVTSEERFDKVSGLGYALGYLGGGILFALNVAMVQQPEWFGLADAAAGVKASFVSVALWWMLFALPFVLWVKEKRNTRKIGTVTLTVLGYRRLMRTFHKIKHLRGLFLFLVAYWFYIDGVDTIIRMAVDYGMAIGFEAGDLIKALLLVQFVGFPATILVAKLAQMWDTKKAIYLTLGFYVLIAILAAFMHDVSSFYLLAAMIALVQGGIQAMSRSYYSKMIPAEYAAEFFGFYNFLGKFATVLGPLLIGAVALATESSRAGIASVAVFFVIGALLLYMVDEKAVAEEVRGAMR